MHMLPETAPGTSTNRLLHADMLAAVCEVVFKRVTETVDIPMAATPVYVPKAIALAGTRQVDCTVAVTAKVVVAGRHFAHKPSVKGCAAGGCPMTAVSLIQLPHSHFSGALDDHLYKECASNAQISWANSTRLRPFFLAR
jgi:hypothetical protein